MDSLRTVCYIHWVLYTGCGVHHVTGTYTINGDLVDRSTKTPSNGVCRACCALPTTTAPQSCLRVLADVRGFRRSSELRLVMTMTLWLSATRCPPRDNSRDPRPACRS